MCGIAGILDFRGEPVAQAEIDAMAASITHRGPDDRGTFVRGPVGLANNRLAILDVSDAGHQPMTSDDGSLCARLQRRALQLPRAARASWRRAGTRSARAATPRWCCDAWRGVGARVSRPFRRDVRVRGLGRPRADAHPRPRPLRRQAALLRRARRQAALRLGDQGAARGGSARTRLERRAARVLHVPERLLGRDALRRRSHAARRAPHAVVGMHWPSPSGTGTSSSSPTSRLASASGSNGCARPLRRRSNGSS